MKTALLASSALLLVGAVLPASAASLDDLVAAAKAEGELTVIALPHDWCGYGGVIDGFKKKYGLKVNELNPDAGSGDEIEAIKANKGNKGPQAPDVIDVGLSFGPSAKAEGLLMPYKVSTWDTIPASQKDPEGYWTGDYYGVLSFEVNKDIVKTSPSDWADLLKPEYKNAVALAGDPRASSQAIQGVYAAGLSAAKGDAAKAGEAGLKFFADLNKAGNFVPVIGKAASLAQGATPIVIRWDYNALADRDTLKRDQHAPAEADILRSVAEERIDDEVVRFSPDLARRRQCRAGAGAEDLPHRQQQKQHHQRRQHRGGEAAKRGKHPRVERRLPRR